MAVLATACNAIIGVEDTTLRGPGEKPKAGNTAGDGAGNQSGGDGNGAEGDGQRGSRLTASQECDGTPDCKRLAFVTRQKFTGNLGGIAGADQKCFEAAKAIPGFGGRAFRAWLSDSTGAAKDRLPKGTAVYRRVDDSTVAATFSDLVDGTLKQPLSLDESGARVGSGSEGSVWTGSMSDGSDSSFNCFDWTSESSTQSGTFGDSAASDRRWTDNGEGTCDAARHLYCVEY